MKETFLASDQEALENVAQAFNDNSGWEKVFVASNGFVYGPEAGNTAMQMKDMNKVEVIEVTRADFLAFQSAEGKTAGASAESGLPETEEFKAGIQKLKEAKVHHSKIKAIKTQEELDAALAALEPKE